MLETSSKALGFFKVMFPGAAPLMKRIKVSHPGGIFECNSERAEVPYHPMVGVLIGKLALFIWFP
jgi:hypothetical protein